MLVQARSAAQHFHLMQQSALHELRKRGAPRQILARFIFVAGNQHHAVLVGDGNFINQRRANRGIELRVQPFIYFQRVTHIIMDVFGQRGGWPNALVGGVGERVLHLQKDVVRQILGVLVGFLQHLLQQLPQKNHGQNCRHQKYQRGHHQRQLCAQPQLHGRYSASARSVPYSLSLLCSVFRLMPSRSAARVLLFPVAPSVCKISSRSIATTVVPTGNLMAAKSLGPFVEVFPNSPGREDREIKSFSHIIAARSSTLRSSRIFPGHVWLIKMSITSAPTPRTCLPCLALTSRKICSTSRGMSSLWSRSGGKLM